MKVETKSKSTGICEETSLIVREKLTIQRKNSLNSSARWLRNSHNLSGLVRKWPSVSVTPVALEKVESLLVANMLKDAGLLETGNFVAKACLEFLGIKFGMARRQLVSKLPKALKALVPDGAGIEKEGSFIEFHRVDTVTVVPIRILLAPLV